MEAKNNNKKPIINKEALKKLDEQKQKAVSTGKIVKK